MFVSASEGLVEVKRTHSVVSSLSSWVCSEVDVARSSGFSLSAGYIVEPTQGYLNVSWTEE